MSSRRRGAKRWAWLECYRARHKGGTAVKQGKGISPIPPPFIGFSSTCRSLAPPLWHLKACPALTLPPPPISSSALPRQEDPSLIEWRTGLLSTIVVHYCAAWLALWKLPYGGCGEALLGVIS